MLRIEFDDGPFLKLLVRILSNTIFVSRWECREDGITIEQMDETRAILTVLKLDKKAIDFWDFQFSGINSKVDLDLQTSSLVNIFKCSKQHDKLVLTAKYNESFITLHFATPDPKVKDAVLVLATNSIELNFVPFEPIYVNPGQRKFNFTITMASQGFAQMMSYFPGETGLIDFIVPADGHQFVLKRAKETSSAGSAVNKVKTVAGAIKRFFGKYGGMTSFKQRIQREFKYKMAWATKEAGALKKWLTENYFNDPANLNTEPSIDTIMAVEEFSHEEWRRILDLGSQKASVAHRENLMSKGTEKITTYIQTTEAITGTFSIRHVNSIVKAHPLASIVEIAIESNETPLLRVTYSFDKKKPDSLLSPGSLTYYLAPAVDEDANSLIDEDE